MGVYHGVESLDSGGRPKETLERMNSNDCQKHTFSGPVDVK